MKIIGKIEVDGYLRIEDLEPGEVFAFLDDDKHLYIATDSVRFIDLETGESLNSDYHFGYEDKPIKRINAKIIIEG